MRNSSKTEFTRRLEKVEILNIIYHIWALIDFHNKNKFLDIEIQAKHIILHKSKCYLNLWGYLKINNKLIGHMKKYVWSFLKVISDLQVTYKFNLEI